MTGRCIEPCSPWAWRRSSSWGSYLAFFFDLAPPGQHTGVRADVLGVYAYDPQSGGVAGDPRTRFSASERFAARVAWGSLPPGMTVGARWYDGREQLVGSIGPAGAAELAQRAAVVAEQKADGGGNLPGDYALLVLRLSGSRPVEILGRTDVVVERGG